MSTFIKCCCLFIIAFGFTAIGFADEPPAGAKPEPAKEEACPEGQTFDKELKACISKPADEKGGKVEKSDK